MKQWWAIPFGVLCGFLVAGLLFLASSPPRGDLIPLLPPPTPIPIQVYVVGAVRQPGLHALLPGSRVSDALEAAGGLSSDANPQLINLAAFLQDGERVYVPSASPVQEGPSPGEPQTSLSSLPININTATLAELEVLPGIGPVTAEKIIAYRETMGGYGSIDDILGVPGIGPVTFERIKDMISVEDLPPP